MFWIEYSVLSRRFCYVAGDTRSGRQLSIDKDVLPSVIKSDIDLPMAGLNNMPFFPAPVAKNTLDHEGAGPMIGNQSGVTGFRQAVCKTNVASANRGINVVAPFMIDNLADSVKSLLNPFHSSVLPHQI